MKVKYSKDCESMETDSQSQITDAPLTFGRFNNCSISSWAPPTIYLLIYYYWMVVVVVLEKR